MKVSYPMYALPETQASLNRWWTAIFNRLKSHSSDIPESLTQADDDLIKHWLSDDLLLSQTCGFPLVSRLKSQVKLVGTPVFSAPGCEGGQYCSFFIVHQDDPRSTFEEFKDARFTFNGTDSQSGFNAARVYLLENNLSIPFFGENIRSGGHRNSIINVGRGDAQICAVDCATYSQLKMHQPEVLENTRILTQTKRTPGLPFITSVNTDDDTVDALFNAITDVCNDEAMSDVCRDLQIKGIEKIDLNTYFNAIQQPEPPVEKL